MKDKLSFTSWMKKIQCPWNFWFTKTSTVSNNLLQNEMNGFNYYYIDIRQKLSIKYLTEYPLATTHTPRKQKHTIYHTFWSKMAFLWCGKCFMSCSNRETLFCVIFYSFGIITFRLELEINNNKWKKIFVTKFSQSIF